MITGDLTARITLRRATYTANEFNEPVETWADLITVWAAAHLATDVERWRAQEIGVDLTARFTIRYEGAPADLGPADRVLFEGRDFNITSLRPYGRRRREWLEINAVARVEA